MKFINVIIRNFVVVATTFLIYINIAVCNENCPDLYKGIPLETQSISNILFVAENKEEIKKSWNRLNNHLIREKAGEKGLSSLFEILDYNKIRQFAVDSDRVNNFINEFNDGTSLEDNNEVKASFVFKILELLIKKITKNNIDITPNDFFFQWLRLELAKENEDITTLNEVIYEAFSSDYYHSILLSLTSDVILKKCYSVYNETIMNLKGKDVFIELLKARVALLLYSDNNNLDELNTTFENIVKNEESHLNIFTLFGDRDNETILKSITNLLNKMSQVEGFNPSENNFVKWLKKQFEINKKDTALSPIIKREDVNLEIKQDQYWLPVFRLIRFQQFVLSKLQSILHTNYLPGFIQYYQDKMSYDNLIKSFQVLITHFQILDKIKDILQNLNKKNESIVIYNIASILNDEDNCYEHHDVLYNNLITVRRDEKGNIIDEKELIKSIFAILNSPSYNNKIDINNPFINFLLLFTFCDEFFLTIKNSPFFYPSPTTDTDGLNLTEMKDSKNMIKNLLQSLNISENVRNLFWNRYNNTINIIHHLKDNPLTSDQTKSDSTNYTKYQEAYSILIMLQSIINLGFIPVDLSGNEDMPLLEQNTTTTTVKASLGYDVLYIGTGLKNKNTSTLNLLEVKSTTTTAIQSVTKTGVRIIGNPVLAIISKNEADTFNIINADTSNNTVTHNIVIIKVPVVDDEKNKGYYVFIPELEENITPPETTKIELSALLSLEQHTQKEVKIKRVPLFYQVIQKTFNLISKK